MIGDGNFRWTEGPIPTPQEGQVLVRNLWLSFDPTQRGWMSRDTYVPMIPLGDVMRAVSVGQVIGSRHPSYEPGELVQGTFGWQDYIATDGTGIMPMRKLPVVVPPNLALSLFGVTGLTAYFGVLDIGQVKAAETVLVSAAAGATGIGQIFLNRTTQLRKRIAAGTPPQTVFPHGLLELCTDAASQGRLWVVF